jgi:hypothetical protein
MYASSIEIDIPCDPQQRGEFAMPFALLSEARDPARIEVGAIVITADEHDALSAELVLRASSEESMAMLL